MGEVEVNTQVASTYLYDNVNWNPLGEGGSIGLYYTSSTNFYRIVALNSDGTASINNQVLKDFMFTKLSDNFYRQNISGMVQILTV